MSTKRATTVTKDAVIRLWFKRQGLAEIRSHPLSRSAFIRHLDTTAALQIDSVNVLERAHYLTLWSRFGAYDKNRVDQWIYRDRVAFEYWGHEASVLAAERLPLARRAMRSFNPQGSWWQARTPSRATTRRVLGRIRNEGPLESADFKSPTRQSEPWWGFKEDKLALEFLWRRGRLATHERRNFRRVFDLAERIYPKGRTATAAEFEDSWLLDGLKANGIANEKQLTRYLTSPELRAAKRAEVIKRNLKRNTIVPVQVDDLDGLCYARPEDLDALHDAPSPTGTTLLSPFDSLLWHRERAEQLLNFRYRIEIYTPPAKRTFGYYVMPILHNGALVGRLDPKLHRTRSPAKEGNRLEIKSIHLEPPFKKSAAFTKALGEAVRDLAKFVAADEIIAPRGRKKIA